MLGVIFHLSRSNLNGVNTSRLFSITRFVSNNASVPWYLRPEESPAINSPLNKVILPEFPQSSPQTLKNIVEFAAAELGFNDLEIFDVRNLDGNQNVNEGASDLGQYMVIGTGKSPKHLQKASAELNFFIKENYHKLASTEGILKSGALARYHRRLQKKGKKAPAYSQNDYGASPNTWVMTDCKTDGIVVHLLTKERRKDLNLEHLWACDKSKYEPKRIESESDDIFSGIRFFHNSVIRTNKFNPMNITVDNYTNEFHKLCMNHIVDSQNTTLNDLQNHLETMQSSGLQVTVPILKKYYETLLQSNELHMGITNPTDAFNKRFSIIKSSIQMFQPNFNKDDIVSLIPVLLSSGSQFDHPNFSTPNKLATLNETSSISYSFNIKSIARLLTKITSLRSRTNDQQFLNLVLLSIYANAKDWKEFNKVIYNSVKTNDIQILKMATILISQLGSPMVCSDFKDSYLPLVIEYDPTDLNQYIDIIIEKSNM